jgi:hypothetical protein
MYASEKYIRVLLSKPLKWFCVMLILLISAFSFAYNHQAAITPMVKVIQPKTELPPHTQLVSGLIKKHTAASLLLVNPPDITMNVCGTSATLIPANIPTGYSNLTWNDGSTQPTLNVTTSGTYWWQVTGTNVVTNGDFSAGDTGFTSNYTDVTTNTPNGSQLYPEATYAVGKNPQAYHNMFTSFGDHTTGTGNMLIVNGASVANQAVWAENVMVTPNTNYVFSIWATSASPTYPAILQFSINNTSLGTLSLTQSLPDGTWQYFTATWNSGNLSGSYPISLVNQNTASGGNDFAIDDIVFAPVYRQNIIVNLNPIPVLSVIGEICGVPSYDLTQTIVGYAPGTYNYTFKDGSGTILSGTQITSAPIGTYTITETNIATGCTSNPQNTTVTINPVPTLSVTSPPMTQCTAYDLKSAINGYDATTYTYTYQNGATTLGSSVVSASGTYTITATNKATGCVSNPQNVTVTINLLTDLTVANPNLACGITTYDLYNAITSTTTGYTYIYEDMAGNVLGNGTSFTVTGNATNTYQIIEQNAAGCQSAPQTVTITFKPTPVLMVNSPICAIATTYNLQNAIVGYDPTDYNYTYERNGTIRTGTQITAAPTNRTYTIYATDKITGCVSATQTVNIYSNALPTFTATSPALACGVTSYDLSQAISAAGNTYTYAYQDGGGNTLASSTVTASGTYSIIATATTAPNCISAAHSVTVTFNPLPILTVTSPPAQCGGTFDLHSAINSPDATVTYTYSSGASSVVTTSGAYTITATKNGCSTPATVNVTINPLPVLSVTSPPAQCGGTYDLKSAINGYDATTYTYTYQNGATTLGSSVVSASGTYTITEQNKTTGCISLPQTTTVTINPIPVLSLSSPHTVCGSYDLTQTISGYTTTAPTYTYTFTNPSGTTITTAAAQAVTQSGTYTITETNISTGCTSLPQTTTVTINPNPLQPGITAL